MSMYGNQPKLHIDRHLWLDAKALAKISVELKKMISPEATINRFVPTDVYDMVVPKDKNDAITADFHRTVKGPPLKNNRGEAIFTKDRDFIYGEMKLRDGQRYLQYKFLNGYWCTCRNKQEFYNLHEIIDATCSPNKLQEGYEGRYIYELLPYSPIPSFGPWDPGSSTTTYEELNGPMRTALRILFPWVFYSEREGGR